MRVVVSGPADPDPRASIVIRHDFEWFKMHKHVTAIGTGCAEGVDTISALNARLVFDDLVEHHLFVPQAPSMAKFLIASYGNWHVHQCESGSTNAEAYGNRNTEMCAWALADEDGGCLVACPNQGREVKRGSGTWWTVRIAERLGLPVIIHPLDRSPVVRV